MIKLSKYWSPVIRRFMVSGLSYNITGNFGIRVHPITGDEQDFHTGTDFSVPSGTKLAAPFDGEVTLVQMSTATYGYGGRVLIATQTNDGTWYTAGVTHVKKVNVKKGDKVKYHQEIALSGGGEKDPYAGASTGAHVHNLLIKGKWDRIPDKKILEERKYFIDPEKFDWTIFDKKHEPKPNEVKVGDTVKVNGALFTSSNGNIKGITNHKNKEAKIERIIKNAKHPYYVKGKSISGWADLSHFGIVTPTPTPSIKVGSKVKINKGAYYQGAAKGKKVSTYSLLRTHTVDKIDGANARLQPINSWVALKDLKAV